MVDITAHMGLVWNVARRSKWQTAIAITSMTEEDLVSAGYLGLIKAGEKFDETKGTKFSTYAVYWIENYIRREIQDQCRTVRVPRQTAVKAWKTGKPYPINNAQLPSDSNQGVCDEWSDAERGAILSEEHTFGYEPGLDDGIEARELTAEVAEALSALSARE
jgi:RNA polymerase sigma factor (sigma-70 family)